MEQEEREGFNKLRITKVTHTGGSNKIDTLSNNHKYVSKYALGHFFIFWIFCFEKVVIFEAYSFKSKGLCETPYCSNFSQRVGLKFEPYEASNSFGGVGFLKK